MPIDLSGADAAPSGTATPNAAAPAARDLRLLHAAAHLSDRAPEQLLGAVAAWTGVTASYERLRAGVRLPNAVRAELKGVLDERIRREVEIGAACAADSRALARLILTISGLVVLAAMALAQ